MRHTTTASASKLDVGWFNSLAVLPCSSPSATSENVVDRYNGERAFQSTWSPTNASTFNEILLREGKVPKDQLFFADALSRRSPSTSISLGVHIDVESSGGEVSISQGKKRSG